MAIKSILVPFNADPGAQSALALTLALAERRGAAVTGLFAHGVARARAQLSPWLTEDLDRVLTARETEERASVADRFWKTMEPRRDSTAYVDLTGDPTAALVEFARTYDMVVIGRFDPESGYDAYAPSPDVVALQCGRPVLVTPPDYAGSGDFPAAVLAWDGKRAAARAMGDAIAILPEGAKITVVSIGDDEGAYRRAHRDPVEQLRRHGFDVSFRLMPGGRRTVAESLLRACSETGAELLIMGAYEHSKFSEDLLGGVTARVLRETTVPTLMAH
jgi:nucleotide-binding universal stress UspA family protein